MKNDSACRAQRQVKMILRPKFESATHTIFGHFITNVDVKSIVQKSLFLVAFRWLVCSFNISFCLIIFALFPSMTFTFFHFPCFLVFPTFFFSYFYSFFLLFLSLLPTLSFSFSLSFLFLLSTSFLCSFPFSTHFLFTILPSLFPSFIL